MLFKVSAYSLKHYKIFLLQEGSYLLFKDNVVIVTGAASGIGKACSLSFAEKGAKVIVVDLNKKGLEETNLKIHEKDGTAITIIPDITKKDNVNKIVTFAVNNFGKIDALINCAGICQIIKVEDSTEKEWDRDVCKFKKDFLFMPICFKGNEKCQKGKIVNMGYEAGEIGGVLVGANYSASKAGIVCLTKSLAKYAASYNININSVSPGFIDTEMTKDLGQDPKNVSLVLCQVNNMG